MFTSVIYAVLLALLICALAFKVISARRKHKVKHADGGFDDLQVARSAHSNATEYIPIALILLFALEYNGSVLWLVHIIGCLLVLGRVIHAKAILSDNLRGRVIGMQLTFLSIAVLSLANLYYFLLRLFPLFGG